MNEHGPFRTFVIIECEGVNDERESKEPLACAGLDTCRAWHLAVESLTKASLID